MTAILPPRSTVRQWLYENSLLLVPTLLILMSLGGQAVTGWHVHNEEREQLQLAALTFGEYLRSGHFIEATFENWESEFLQMGLYVVLTIWLRQKGSSESKKIDETEKVDREPDPTREGAPWAVRRGGVVSWIYQRSLSLAFLALFLASVLLHAYGGVDVHNLEQVAEGKPAIGMWEYMTTSQFWFESLQNWQSEMVAIVAIVGLSIFLRQKGSPESKPVDVPNCETED
jgi:hypothetical protein